MGNKKNVIMYMCVVMMVICFSVGYSYSQEKPSGKVLIDIMILLEKQSNSLPKYIKHMKLNSFVITNNFISSINGRYCVEANFDVSYEGRESTIAEFKQVNNKFINKRYSFVKKYNQWLGYKGWGPGEN